MNTYKYSVDPENIDFNGQITIPALCSHAINAIAQNIRVEGYGVDVLAKEKRTWVLLRSAFEIDERPGLYDIIYVNVWPVAGSNGLTYNRCVRILDSRGRELGRGTTEWCVIDIESRRPIISALDCSDEVSPIPCRSPKRIRDFEPQFIDGRRVRYSECDFNGHLNNIKYVDMMYDMLPDSIIETDSKVRLDINYRHEALRGADISTGIRQEGDNQFLFIARSADRTLCSASIERCFT